MAAEAREPFRDAQKRLKDATLKRLHEACRLGRSDDVMKMMVITSLNDLCISLVAQCTRLLRFAPVCTVPALCQILSMLRLLASFGLSFAASWQTFAAAC